MFDARIKLKHDTTENWNNAVDFVPLAGELIIYDDYSSTTYEEDGRTITQTVPAIKIGDGITTVTDLPFASGESTGGSWEDITDKPFSSIDSTTLKVENGVLKVNATDDMLENDGRPITSGGTYSVVGDIEYILGTI